MDTKLYIGNLSPVTTTEDLRMLFATAGRVESVEVVRDKKTGRSKGFAFVSMVSQGDTGKAVSEFNGFILDQHRLKVTVAKAGNSQPKRVVGFTEYKSYNESIRKSP